MEVMLNNDDKTIVRLTAAPVSEEIANNRRRKAKQENKKPPSEEYLKLLSWSVYLTTIPKEQASYSQLLKVYGVRWRIEIIFKSWKSYMCFEHIHNVSLMQLHVLLLARFIMIIIYIQYILPSCQNIVARHSDKRLSLLKITNYLNREPQKIVALIEEVKQYKGKIQRNIAALIRYCTYDKRKRKNFEQQMDELFTLS